MGKDSIAIEGVMELQYVIRALETISEGMCSGHITLDNGGGETIDLRPVTVVGFECKVHRKKDMEKMSLKKIKWKKEAR